MKKLSLNFKNKLASTVLSREQMKTVMGGNDPVIGTIDDSLVCKTQECSGTDLISGKKYSGSCGVIKGSGPVLDRCGCVTSTNGSHGDSSCGY